MRSITQLTNGKEYHVIGIYEWTDGTFCIGLDHRGSTAIGFLDARIRSLQEQSNKHWNPDELRELAIEWKGRK